MISKCSKFIVLPNKVCIKLQYFSRTYKIQEIKRDSVLLTVKIDLEDNNSFKSKLFILYLRSNL